MTDFQTWDRQVFPQGRLVTPPAAPSLAEAFGQGVADLATTVGATADQIKKTDQWRKAKEWEIVGQPKAAALVNKLQVDFAEALPDLKANAAPGLSDYPDKIDEAIIGATEAALKDNPDPQFQRYVRTQMDEFRAASVVSGIQEKTAATLVHDANDLQDTVNGQSKLVAKDFSQFDRAANLVDDIVKGNQHFTADQKKEFSRITKHALARAGLDALVDRDPDAALKALNSGKFDDVLTQDDVQGYRHGIKSEQDRRKRVAEIAAAQQAEKQQADDAVAIKNAFKEAHETGKYAPGIPAVIKRADPKNYETIQQSLDIARATGGDNLVIPAQSPAENRHLLDQVTLALSADTHNPVLIERYKNIKQQLWLKQAALRNDPEEYVRSHTPAVQQAWDDFIANPHDPGKTLTALETANRAQSKQNLAPNQMRLVPQKIVDGIVDEVRQAGPGAIEMYQKNFGDYFPHVMAGVTKYGPFMTAAMMLDNPKQQSTQAVLLELSRDPQSVVKLEQFHKIDEARKAAIQKVVFDDIDDLRQSYAGYPGGDSAFVNLSISAYALTLRHMFEDHMPLRDAASHAAGEIGMSYYAFGHLNGHLFRVPIGAAPELVIAGATVYAASISGLAFDPPVDRPNMEREAVARSLASSGRWANLPDDSGLKLVFAEGQPAKIDGKEVNLTWAQLRQVAANYAPDLFGQSNPENSQ